MSTVPTINDDRRRRPYAEPLPSTNKIGRTQRNAGLPLFPAPTKLQSKEMLQGFVVSDPPFEPEVVQRELDAGCRAKAVSITSHEIALPYPIE
jgi:hypothetical protein